MLLRGIQPQAPQNSWLLNLLAAQQSLRPAMLHMGPNAFAQAYQGGKFPGVQPNGMPPSLPSQAAMLIQQLQQSQNAGRLPFFSALSSDSLLCFNQSMLMPCLVIITHRCFLKKPPLSNLLKSGESLHVCPHCLGLVSYYAICDSCVRGELRTKALASKYGGNITLCRL